MGYTHYFSTAEKVSKNEWDEIVGAFVKIVEKSGVKICNGMGEPATTYTITPDYISFNGCGDESHETMHLQRQPIEFEFCKTNRKAYDKVVVALLEVAKGITNQKITYSSDGSEEEREDGIKLAKEVLGA